MNPRRKNTPKRRGQDGNLVRPRDCSREGVLFSFSILYTLQSTGVKTFRILFRVHISFFFTDEKLTFKPNIFLQILRKRENVVLISNNGLQCMI